MRDLIQIKVVCHSGYKADEYPVCFYLNDLKFNIEEIVDRWYDYNRNAKSTNTNYFKIKTKDGKIYILKNELMTDKWYLWVYGESMNL